MLHTFWFSHRSRWQQSSKSIPMPVPVKEAVCFLNCTFCLRTCSWLHCYLRSKFPQLLIPNHLLFPYLRSQASKIIVVYSLWKYLANVLKAANFVHELWVFAVQGSRGFHKRRCLKIFWPPVLPLLIVFLWHMGFIY